MTSSHYQYFVVFFFFFQAEDGIRDKLVTGVQTCALPISDQLAKLAITVPEIVTAIQSQNTVNPAGQVGSEPVPKGQEYTYSVRAQGRLTSPEEFGQIVVRESLGGAVVRLKEVAATEA